MAESGAVNIPIRAVPMTEATAADNMSTPDGASEDILMQDVTTRPASPTSSEEELISDEMEKEVQKEVGYTSGIDSDTIDYSERRPGRSEDMGEIIALAFPYDTEMEYEDDADQERDIFDNGLEDDDSASESDASSTYEELMEPDIITKIIRAPASDSELEDGEDQELEDNCRDDAYSSDEAFASEYEAETETPKDSIEEAQNPPEQAHQEPTLSTEIQPLPKKSFSELQATKFKLLYQKAQYAPARVYRGVLIPEYTKDTGHRPTISLDEDCDNLRWKLLELEEAKKKIDLLITLRSAQLEAAESAKEAAEETFETQLQHSGISQELYNAYQAFCDSLDPEFGQRGGFSITCDADHQGSYPGYDAEFAIFKECVEIPYTQCNFRCEASKENSRKWILKDEKTQQRGWVPSIDSVVEFWPIKSPEPMNGTESTWGEQYSELYTLASAAVRAGSEAAMEMLIALPDMNSSFNGGWMFDYQFEQALKSEPVISKRWRFRSAHKIDKPCSVEAKRARVELLLRPENVV